jgi:predicted permease
MTLLVSAGLFVRSLARLWTVDLGFDPAHLVSARVELTADRYPEPANRADFLRRLEERLEARPEVVGVAASAPAILGNPSRRPLQAEGRDPTQGQPITMGVSVRSDYIDVIGLDLVAGRGLRDEDANTSSVVVDLDLARFLWEDEHPVGRRFRLGEDGEWYTVVGVVRDYRFYGRDERYFPYQILLPADPADTPMQANFPLTDVAVRFRGDPEPLLPVVREAVAALDPEMSVLGVGTFSRALASQEQQPRFLATLMVLFAGVAVSLAAVGLFGVLAYTVSLRRRELGIRAALGASRRRLRTMVLRQGLGMATMGILAGIGGSYLASRTLARFLYEVEPGDPGTLIATTTLFLLVAAAASHLPARRATAVDPVEVLRAE